jgi:hypothetical protein
MDGPPDIEAPLHVSNTAFTPRLGRIIRAALAEARLTYAPEPPKEPVQTRVISSNKARVLPRWRARRDNRRGLRRTDGSVNDAELRAPAVLIQSGTGKSTQHVSGDLDALPGQQMGPHPRLYHRARLTPRGAQMWKSPPSPLSHKQSPLRPTHTHAHTQRENLIEISRGTHTTILILSIASRRHHPAARVAATRLRQLSLTTACCPL